MPSGQRCRSRRSAKGSDSPMARASRDNPRQRWTGILMDADPNPAGAVALAAYLSGEAPRPMVFGAMADKAVAGIFGRCCRRRGGHRDAGLQSARRAAHRAGARRQDLAPAVGRHRRIAAEGARLAW